MNKPTINNRLTRWQVNYIKNAYRELASGITRRRLEAFGLSLQGKRLLDVGCGPGNFLVAVAADSPKQIVGVDLDEQFLTVARTELNLRSMDNFALLKATAASLPFPDQFFDVVTCFLVLPHVPDDKAALVEMARVLKKGGILAISGHDKGFPLRYLKRLRFKALSMYLWSLIYALTGKKVVRNTFQNYKKVCKHLAEIGFVIDDVTLSRKSLGLVETYRIKAIKERKREGKGQGGVGTSM